MKLLKLAKEMEHKSGLVAGVDEAGRGPLAGPVISAAVILPNKKINTLINDSKKMTHKQRIKSEEIIKRCAVAWSIGIATEEEIDDINIHNATLLAMTRAIYGLRICPDKVLIDGLFCPPISIECEAIVKGDSKINQISAASVLAKVYRDEYMERLSAQYPNYGFEKHKGYPTKLHIDRLKENGPTPHHRRTFKPVSEIIKKSK